MFYDRKVKYLDYCECGERVRGCGVLKMQIRDKRFYLELMVSGLQTEDSCCLPIMISAENGDFELGSIQIQQGRGSYRYQCADIDEVLGAAPYEKWTGLQIVLDDQRIIQCIWGQKVQEIMECKRKAEKSRTDCEETLCHNQNESRRLPEAKHQDQSIQLRSLADDKWSQLWKIYPHVNPFRDDREYLSIRPADFVLFTEDSYKAINNSFLLHGFYNYQHLLLGKMERNGDKIFYVGVPGNYFEREKQVAVMFGFESFECQEEPAQAGDFGYYMMRAKL